jgi:putrescine transport system substrate-binding protein
MAALVWAAALALAADPALARGDLNVLIWSDYFAGPAAVAEFAKSEDLRITYGILDSDDTLQAKLLSGHSGYDVVYPSSTYIARSKPASTRSWTGQRFRTASTWIRR